MSAHAHTEGELAIVLHTHMPYVEGYGTWPFGEEWLWEVMATSYLPLLDLLEAGAPVTLSLTPVLCDQLAAPGIGERFTRFITEVRRATHAEDVRGLLAGQEAVLAAEVERAALDYERALERHEEIGGRLLERLAAHATWTSAATHAVLPLCATDAGARLQIEAGIASHRARVEAWRGGFWLPECAYAPWLGPLLVDSGVRASCVDLTDRFGLGAPEHLQPLRTPDGLVLVPLDRVTIELPWSDGGYPAHGSYRDYHRHTLHHCQPWANDGAAYDHDRALAVARDHAADFVSRTHARVLQGGLAVCAFDTELLGHWWYEGLAWLEAVVEEAERQGLTLSRLDDALERHEPIDTEDLGVSSWGSPRDLSTWDGTAVAELAFGAREAELRVLDAGRDANPVAIRELLALQASDWAFMASRGLAADYPHERAAAHTGALSAALASNGSDNGKGNGAAGPRNLGLYARAETLLAP